MMIDWLSIRNEINRMTALDLAKRMIDDPMIDALIRAHVKSYPEEVLQRDFVSRSEKSRLEAAIFIRDGSAFTVDKIQPVEAPAKIPPAGMDVI